MPEPSKNRIFKSRLALTEKHEQRAATSGTTIIASARLHGIDPEEYLRCLIRLVPLWPADRMLELAPLFWARTRDRIDPKRLAQELGPIDIPLEPLDTSTPEKQQAAG